MLDNQVYRRALVICTGVLICPQPDKEGNKLQRQKILIFIYPTYNQNWMNISTIYIYIYIYREVGRAKDLSAPLHILENLLQNFMALCARIEFLGASMENNRKPYITLCEKAHICHLDYSLLSRSRIIYVIWNIYTLVQNRVHGRSQDHY